MSGPFEDFSLESERTTNREGSELRRWQSVFRGYFGPEGSDPAIADKNVQDLRAELRMAQSDNETAQGERDAAVDALDASNTLMKAADEALEQAQRERDALAAALLAFRGTEHFTTCPAGGVSGALPCEPRCKQAIAALEAK